METAQAKFMERHKTNIEATEKVFCTAYECAKSHLPFREHTRLMELQSINGIACGEVLQSYHSCANIVGHVANCMHSEIVDYIKINKINKCPFSILIDESTSVANVQSVFSRMCSCFVFVFCKHWQYPQEFQYRNIYSMAKWRVCLFLSQVLIAI